MTNEANKDRKSGRASYAGKQGKKLTAVLVVVAITLGLLSGVALAFFGITGLGDLENFTPSQATILYDSQGRVIGKLFEQNRVVIPFSQMPAYLQHAIVSVEDERFYKHFGIDIWGIARAMWVNIRSGSIQEGGSTLTQQLAKEAMLTQEQTWTRKIKDALLALVIERRYTKQEILEAYLNQIYLGEGAYGVEAASQLYFGKHTKELTLAECALLAGVVRIPEYYSPYVHPEDAKGRRNLVLSKMVEQGYITEQQAKEAKNEPIRLAGKKARVAQASYFMDYVANQLVEKYGANKVYRGGLKIYTGLDIDMQQAAEATLGKYQGALVAIDPKTGYIKAMVGGRNYQESQLNRATTFFRQPGSLMKPFVYAVAIDQGHKQNDIIIDEPININKYSPQNFDKKFRGPITMKKAIRLSVNVAAVKMLNQVGIDKVINYAANLGISSLVPEDRNLALALGGITKGVNLLEITNAYAAFANQGIKNKPITIVKVEDADGRVLEEHRVDQKNAVRPETAYLVTDMMRAVIEAPDGTGAAARIDRPAAGKTGTTDQYVTAWFVGYTPELAAGLYVGNDNMEPVGVSGGYAASLWGEFMKKATAKLPATDFIVPSNVVTGVRVATDTGKLATNRTPEVEIDAFVRGSEPRVRDDRRAPQSIQDEEEIKQKNIFPWLKIPWPF
jgi:penicillin-binding protein 1A